MRVALVLPPLTQLNTPYPSTAYLARHLREQGVSCQQRDLGIELVLRLFSRQGLSRAFDAIEQLDALPEPAWRALALRSQHEQVIEPVIRFLQGRDRTLATRILETATLPQGPRLARADLEGFGPLSADDAARHLATLFLSDLADLITSTLDEGFGLARYQHHLALSPVRFDAIEQRLQRSTLVDTMLDELAATIDADLVGLSVPFPGNLYGALRVGRALKARGVKVLMGGGYVNTELRQVDEPRLWTCIDGLCFDDGEGPLMAWITDLQGGPDHRHRSLSPQGRHEHPAPRPAMTCAAWYGDLPLDRYLQLVDTLNPAHRLWSDGRWNKLTLAHGCYWKKCAFCDVSLDYVGRFEAAEVGRLADAVEELIDDTGQSGFHFVDEAAPPKLLKGLALELLDRGVTATWWGNIRFEPTFTPDLCRLLSAAGLVAVTGGLEVASDRLLKLMKKGVTVEQVARAAAAFRGAGVMVHAYLMYGFPTQTEQETINAMEMVRQLFAADLLSSAFWHRFVLTRHAPVMQDLQGFGVQLVPQPPGVFADNDQRHLDPQGADHDRFDGPLPLALESWMRGRHLQAPLQDWFEHRVPSPTEPTDRIQRALGAPGPMGQRLVWLGGEVQEDEGGLVLHHAEGSEMVHGAADCLQWLAEVLDAARPGQEPLTLDEARAAFPGSWGRFKGAWRRARRAGLIGV